MTTMIHSLDVIRSPNVIYILWAFAEKEYENTYDEPLPLSFAYYYHSAVIKAEKAERRSRLRREAERRLKERLIDSRVQYRNWSKPLSLLTRRVYKEAGESLAQVLRSPDRLDILVAATVNIWTKHPTILQTINNVIAKYPSLSVQFSKLLDVIRLYNSEWALPVWKKALTSVTPWHFAHVRLDDPDFIVYAETPEHLFSNRWTKIRPGKYLKKFYPFLTDTQIKAWAERHNSEYSSYRIEWAYTPEAIAYAVNHGPSESCQSAGYHKAACWYAGHVHPAQAYGPTEETGIAAAYLERDGRIVSRALVNMNKKTFARVYGDASRLIPVLERLGYRQAVHALVGCRLRVIKNRLGRGYIMPYVDAGVSSGDGSLDVVRTDDDMYWELVPSKRGEFSTYCGFENKGVAASEVECAYCGCPIDEHDAACTDDYGFVCDNCLEEHFVYALSFHGEVLIHRAGAIYCESTNSNRWYVNEEEVLQYYNIYQCRVTRRWYLIDDLVFTAHGPVHINEAVKLDEPDREENSYALPGDVVQTHDGRTIMREDAIEREGRIYHIGDEFLIENNEVVGVV